MQRSFQSSGLRLCLVLILLTAFGGVPTAFAQTAQEQLATRLQDIKILLKAERVKNDLDAKRAEYRSESAAGGLSKPRMDWLKDQDHEISAHITKLDTAIAQKRSAVKKSIPAVFVSTKKAVDSAPWGEMSYTFELRNRAKAQVDRLQAAYSNELNKPEPDYRKMFTILDRARTIQQRAGMRGESIRGSEFDPGTDP